MKKRMAVLLFLAAIQFVSPGLGGLPASQEAVRPQKPLEYQVAVTLKLIQVHVSDKKGNPVQDLAKEDFIVRDNGREMTLTEFEKYTLKSAARSGLPRSAEEEIVSGVHRPAEAAGSKSRKFFLFFDFANNNARGIKKSQEAALHFLDAEVQPADEVGLLSYSMVEGLSIHEYLTTNHAKFREAIANMNAQGLSGRADDVEQEYWRLATQETTPPELSRDVLVQRQDARSQARAFILKLTDMAKAFRYIPGHKSILLFSSGITSSLLYGNQAGMPQGGGGVTNRAKLELPDFVLRTQYEEMSRELSAADCSIFAFDSRESAKVPSLFDYDEQTFASRTSRDIFTAAGAQQTNPMIMKDENVTGLYALAKLSKETAGTYYGNINEYKRNLEDLQTLTGSYYVLGYSIGERWDGQFHDIKVEVKRKGLEVRTQSGYFNPKPFAEYTSLEKQLHLFDLALSDRPLFQTPAALPLNTLSFASGERGRLELLSRIPAGLLERFSGKKIELVSLVLDEQENLASLQRTEAELTNAQGADVLCVSGIALAPGLYTCRIVVRDLENGAGAVASGRAFIPQKATLGLSLNTPLLLVLGRHSLYLEPRGEKADSAAWREAYPYDQTLYSPAVGQLPAGAPKVFAVVPCALSGLVRPEIVLTADLIDSGSGRTFELPGTVLNRMSKDGREIFFLELRLADIPPGKYTLYLRADDAVSKSISHSQTSLLIK